VVRAFAWSYALRLSVTAMANLLSGRFAPAANLFDCSRPIVDGRQCKVHAAVLQRNGLRAGRPNLVKRRTFDIHRNEAVESCDDKNSHHTRRRYHPRDRHRRVPNGGGSSMAPSWFSGRPPYRRPGGRGYPWRRAGAETLRSLRVRPCLFWAAVRYPTGAHLGWMALALSSNRRLLLTRRASSRIPAKTIGRFRDWQSRRRRRAEMPIRSAGFCHAPAAELRKVAGRRLLR